MKLNYQEFLSQTAPFNHLPAATLEALSNKVTAFRYRMGQPIMQRGKLLHQVSIIYQGQVRVLGYEPRTQAPTTLKLMSPGGVIGWVNAVRGVACETAIASTEAICLNITSQEFLQLLQESPELKEEFYDRCSITETFDLLGYYFSQKAKVNGNLKDIVHAAMAEAQVCNLPPGYYAENSAEQKILRKSDKLWFVSGGGSLMSCPPRTQLDFEQTENLEVKGIQPARLIGFPETAWTHIIEQQKSEPTEPPLPIDVIPDPFADTPPPNGNGNVTVMDAPDDKEEEEEIPYAPVEIVGLTPEQSAEERRTRRYPLIKAKGEDGVAIACFQMLAQYFEMRFKGDVIRRVVGDQIQRYGGLSLPICGAISELMGLNAQLIKIPIQTVTRLTVPVMVKWRDSLAIIYEVGDREIIVAAPDIGLVKRTPQDFIEGWGDEQGQVEVLLLKKGKYTPEERFGLNWFIPSIKKYKWVLIEVLIASFLFQMLALANPLIIQQIIDKVISQQSADTLQVYGSLLLIFAIAEGILGFVRTSLFVDTTNRIDMTLGSEIIDHLFRLPLQYFERRPVGEISTRVGELEKIRSFLTGTALTVVLDAVFSVVYIFVMLWYSPLLTAVSLAVIPVFIVTTLIFSPIIRKQLRTKAEKNAKSQSYLVEVMTGVQTVKAQNIELRSRWKWQEKYASYVSAGFNTVVTSTASSSISNFLNKLSGLLVLWVGTSLVLKGPEDGITLGQLIAFRIIAGYVTSPILRLTQLWQNFQDTAISLERLADIVDHPQEGEEDRDNIPMPLVKGEVIYENISFRFKKHGPLNLNNVSLIFPAGTFVAIVGQSGAGKSTLTKLLSRLYEPEAGRILVDGYDVNKVELYSLRRQVGVVPQETLLFEGTVQDNIALTNPEAEPEEIEYAAKVADAHDFIMESLPNGYNTQVGERGSSLSGGQKQRIAIARSVLQRPQILVLDEATSALDYLTERKVCNNLKDAFDDTTVFFITHRLDTIKDADTIILMHEGSLGEQGTHDELMAMRGRYYSLYQQQTRGGGS
ncbi:cyclic nucleotide-regulated ABC bacteriocin/lantibiotic exporter [[Leptolyngbya] sp. PCC 7376]|uniref:peptidase domain-containing ABC transporter n=1 Tax=[Leptolyngbya] sp. PCC 7376 TaxID=111781 RepID=UPI00029F00B6|nr:peptidase domain-containing ABC transporter [[Leptolyngbya] sp. PCC 7376]AFY39831.1 cyclic nucleotide-regulated ABC bacteriocin/lantibiotic exporter [[Leptolyngbya] sp. PCC 7376]